MAKLLLNEDVQVFLLALVKQLQPPLLDAALEHREHVLYRVEVRAITGVQDPRELELLHLPRHLLRSVDHEPVHEESYLLEWVLLPQLRQELHELVRIDALLEVHNHINAVLLRYDGHRCRSLPRKLIEVDPHVVVQCTPLELRERRLGRHHLVEVQDAVALGLVLL